jgi:hypothetical protein
VLPASTLRSWARIGAAAILMALPGASVLGARAHAGGTMEVRKLPMQFTWHEAGATGRPTPCVTRCSGFVSAVGSITGDTPDTFAAFAEGRDLTGATIVLDSSGGSVLDAIALGRVWRGLGVHTTVGLVATDRQGPRVLPEAYCESMCVFLLLSGKTRAVPAGAHVRVHQIWMGDRADNAAAASYTAQDVMIIERDIGRLAKFTFDMGGSGELLHLALSVPPWEPLHELSAAELVTTNLVPDAALVADTAAPREAPAAGRVAGKPVQDRFAASALSDTAPANVAKSLDKGLDKGVEKAAERTDPSARSTRTAEAVPPATAPQ